MVVKMSRALRKWYKLNEKSPKEILVGFWEILVPTAGELRNIDPFMTYEHFLHTNKSTLSHENLH
jgi:hypothetical protein